MATGTRPAAFRRIRNSVRTAFLCVLIALAAGCFGRPYPYREVQSPVRAGLSTNDLIDPPAQYEADVVNDVRDLFERAERLKGYLELERKNRPPRDPSRPRRSVLCLSGGGSYGAYTAGVLCGWSARGDRPGCGGRPNFDVVTGISTGALIAPLAFLGPKYDDDLRRFYTTVDNDDIYKLRPVRGAFTIALADNAPLAELVDGVVTEDKVREVAEEHRKGRRLYIGTTDLEGRRFVVWDVGAIACRGCPGDRELIVKILLASSAIPGFFPPAKIPVTVDGRTYVEEHGDGGVSEAIFFRPPYTPSGQRGEGNDLSDVDLYLVVAGKLYADAQALKQRSLTLGAKSMSTVIHAQTRGDLQRWYLVCLVTGMEYHLAAIPPDAPAPASSAEFDRAAMTALFDVGFRLAAEGGAWRRSPPGVEPGESVLVRRGTDLTHQPRGPASGLVLDRDGRPVSLPGSAGPQSVPVCPAPPAGTRED
jgi:hypothetical protein